MERPKQTEIKEKQHLVNKQIDKSKAVETNLNKSDKTEKQIKEEKAEDKKTKSSNIKTIDRIKKTEAIVNGRDLPISTKHAIAICNYIRNKNIDWAIEMLKKVSKLKKPIPMRGEIPHKKGMMSGRYPVSASKEIIKLLKSLRANAIYNGLEIETCVLSCIPNVAPRPYRRFGKGRFKRSHVTLKLKQVQHTKTLEQGK